MTTLPEQHARTTADRIREAERVAYYKGIRNGLTRFAWYENGEQVVGERRYPLRLALADVDREMRMSEPT